MKAKVLKTRKEYNEAIKEVEILLDSTIKKGTPKGDSLELLLLLIEKYEDEHFPIEAPDPIEAIKFRMEQMDMKTKDLETMIGNKSMVSRILNKKRYLTVEMIRNLHDKLNIPTNLLIQKYV